MYVHSRNRWKIQQGDLIVLKDLWQQQDERTRTILVLVVLFALGFGLRLYRLAEYPPYVDEYIHTRRAIELLDNHIVEWDRAYLTVTLPVYLSYRIFGISLWASRLPMVIINMLAIFPLFVLGNKVDRKVGYLAVGLFAVGPWIIAAGRTVRDYAIVPVFFYLVVALLVDLLDWSGQTLKQYLGRHKFRIIILGLILGYVIFDKTSVLKIAVALYGIFGLLIVLKVLKQKPPLKTTIFIVIVGLLLVALIVKQTGIINRYLRSGEIFYGTTNRYWKVLVTSELKQWYYIAPLGYLILLGACYLAVRIVISGYKKADFAILFCILAFAANFIYLTFFVRTPRIPARIRYGVLMEYWYLVVIAIVVFRVYQIAGERLQKPAMLVVHLGTLGLLINVPGIWTAITYPGGGRSPITGDQHYLVDSAYEFLVANLTEDDILLSDVLKQYDQLNGNQLHPRETVSLLRLVFEQSEVGAVIDRNPCGWVAASPNIPDDRLKLPHEDFTFDGKQVRYYGELDEIYLWQWMPISPNSDTIPCNVGIPDG